MYLHARIVLLLLWAPLVCLAQEKHEVMLHYTTLEDGSSSLGMPRFAREQEIRFKKEPALPETGVLRGSIALRSDGSEYIGYAVDAKAGKLYLDQNRNLDLTDDPSGVFTTEPNGYWAEFNNIPIPYKSGDIPLYTLISMQTYTQFNYHWENIRSVWEGSIELYGKRLNLAVSDNLDGVLDEKDQWCADALPTDATAKAPLTRFGELSEMLYFAGHPFALGFEFMPEEDKGAVKVTLTEMTEGLGNVAIAGGGVEFVRFSGAKRALFLDTCKNFQLPQGVYSITDVGLTGGFEGAPKRNSTAKDSFASGETESKLDIGAPLKQHIETNRDGRTLTLNYTLEDAAGLQYQSVSYENRPSYTVLQGGKRVASGTFEYG